MPVPKVNIILLGQHNYYKSTSFLLGQVPVPSSAVDELSYYYGNKTQPYLLSPGKPEALPAPGGAKPESCLSCLNLDLLLFSAVVSCTAFDSFTNDFNSLLAVLAFCIDDAFILSK